LLPTVLYESVTYLVAHVLLLPAASNLFIALFCVVGVVAAMVYALRAFGRDPRLAVLVLPVVYPRCLWWGFVVNAAAIPLTLVGLALTSQLLERPRLGRSALLALCAAATVAAHFFFGCVLLGLALALIVLALPRPARVVAGAMVPLLAAVAYLGWCLAPKGGAHGQLHGLLGELWATPGPPGGRCGSSTTGPSTACRVRPTRLSWARSW
jgi:hypothetical protein